MCRKFGSVPFPARVGLLDSIFTPIILTHCVFPFICVFGRSHLTMKWNGSKMWALPLLSVFEGVGGTRLLPT